ncbi:MAG TPA: 2-octaprenyl-6-methoxyphenyl hydroxylase [Alphaproteobacteria bacterium]|nr:2-octaprenyl-6-methoxyphenyl hydroxylase [Alphaproteobacteria bacterium]HAJ47773.1 2-octaprenyl-6-methoxyphenyl hydroxylase [Alphaproteobacteria bacterium]
MTETLKTDVAIVGGGLVGLTLGLSLVRSGVDAIVLDIAEPSEALEPEFDGRASAIALASRRLFSTLGLDGALTGHTQPINQIMVSDGRVGIGGGAAPVFLHFDHAEIGQTPLGEMIENRHIRFALHEAARVSGLRILAPVHVESCSAGPRETVLTLKDGGQVRARLCVSAQGRDSPLRDQNNIRLTKWSYQQTGIVATVHHERPHDGVAHELFLPSGPFALLPLPGNRSSIVWTERSDAAPAFLALADKDFCREVAKRFGDHWGVIAVKGPRWSYPIGLQMASRYIAPRFALVGDAAHVIHPIAGQGLNLGLRDVAALAEVIVEALRTGEDPGSEIVLARYEKWRAFDNTVMAAGMDVLNRLFSNDWGPLRALRTLGLGIVNEIGPLRRVFMRQAGGEITNAPRLLRGEAL